MNKSIQFKVGLFIVIAALVSAAFFVYLLYARGFFEGTLHYTLVAPNAEGVSVGTPVAFRGIAIGQVASVSLSDAGLARIAISVANREGRWLRRSSRFTLDKPLVGAARIRVDSPDLSSPQLADGAEIPMDMGSATVDIPALAAKVNGILDQLAGVSKNVAHITRKDGEIDTALVNVKTITNQMSGKYGVAQGLLGSEQNAQVLMDTLSNARKLTANLDAVSGKLDRLVDKTDQWAFAHGGVADKADQSLAQIQTMLADVQISLKKLDAILVNLKGLTANLKDGSEDLIQLRAQVDEAVGKANQLITKINRILPGARPGEVKLP